MASKVEGIQPDVLRWARESQGISREDVAAHLGRELEEIEAWEDGTSAPTYSQLEDLAYKLFKRPIAVFFFPQRPDEPDLKQQFRTLPDFELEELTADTRYQLRTAKVLQLSLKELHDGGNPSKNLIFRDIKLRPTDDVSKASVAVRRYLGVTLEEQAKCRTVDDALKMWRVKVEDVGVYVFKHSFKQKSISAFCLPDDEFPIIYLNNGNAKARQIFSIFHELAHLMLGVPAISKTNLTHIQDLAPADRSIEVFCNAFAGEFLVPWEDLRGRIPKGAISDDALATLASRYRVSREVILRRLLDHGLVGQADYERRVGAFAGQGDNGGSGGDYYLNQAAYLGDRYLSLVFSRYYQGRIGIDETAEYLNVKTKSLSRLEELAVQRGIAS